MKRLAVLGLVSALAFTLSPAPAMAAPTNPVITPSTFAAGSSPAVTFEYTLSTDIAGGWYTGIALVGFTIPVETGSPLPVVRPTVSVADIICDLTPFGGPTVTFTNAVLAGIVDPTTDECVSYYFTPGGSTEVWAYYELIGSNPLALGGPQTITTSVTSGGFVAPNAAGTYSAEAYSWDGSAYIDQTISSVSVTGGGGSSPGDGAAIIRQGLPMPASGLCADMSRELDAEFAWGTGVSGGWEKSWQPWAGPLVDGQRTWGWACIRTLVKRGGGAWVVDNSV